MNINPKENPVLKKEYSFKFDELRQNRIEASFYKYGPAKRNFGEHMTNAFENLKLCMAKYEVTHNTEYLCDAANYCMFEYMYPSFTDAYFKATDSDGSAGHVGFTIKELEREMENV